MRILNTQLTARLLRWLEESHDDGHPLLTVVQVNGDITVDRKDGHPLSEAERLEITARLSASTATEQETK